MYIVVMQEPRISLAMYKVAIMVFCIPIVDYLTKIVMPDSHI